MTTFGKAQDSENGDGEKPRTNLNMTAVTSASWGKDKICVGCHSKRSNLNIDDVGVLVLTYTAVTSGLTNGKTNPPSPLTSISLPHWLEPHLPPLSLSRNASRTKQRISFARNVP